MDAYETAIAYAQKRGVEDGANAAGWYTMNTIGGRVTGDVTTTARRLLAGIEDGDPAVLDTFPFADLSGQWADSLTGPQLVEAAVWHATSGASELDNQPEADWFNDICDAYELAFNTAVEDAIGAAARAILE